MFEILKYRQFADLPIRDDLPLVGLTPIYPVAKIQAIDHTTEHVQPTSLWLSDGAQHMSQKKALSVIKGCYDEFSEVCGITVRNFEFCYTSDDSRIPPIDSATSIDKRLGYHTLKKRGAPKGLLLAAKLSGNPDIDKSSGLVQQKQSIKRDHLQHLSKIIHSRYEQVADNDRRERLRDLDKAEIYNIKLDGEAELFRIHPHLYRNRS